MLTHEVHQLRCVDLAVIEFQDATVEAVRLSMSCEVEKRHALPMAGRVLAPGEQLISQRGQRARRADLGEVRNLLALHPGRGDDKPQRGERDSQLVPSLPEPGVDTVRTHRC